MTQLLTRREVIASGVTAGLALAASVETPRPWRVLIVVAHPDDEYYVAATTYRLAQELGAVVDHAVLTNGEGGFRYSTLAERVYDCQLTNEATGRARLPEIRRKETLGAGRILGVRKHYFFDQPDRNFTLDIDEPLHRLWDAAALRRSIRELIDRERYDFIFTLLPRATTHGHHQAAALLASEAAALLPPEVRPVILAADASPAAKRAPYEAPAGREFFKTASAQPDFAFDRRRSFGHENALHYSMIVHWVIAEHKSQGMFQNDWGRDDLEQFWLLTATAPPGAEARVAKLRDDLARPRREPARLTTDAGAAGR